MNPVWIAGNAIAVVTALICRSYLRYERKGVAKGLPWISIAIIGLTAVVTGLQFVYPGLVALFQRDSAGLRSGEVWRVVTPMFVQPNGVSQCVLNGFLFVMFLPLCERLYGKGLLTIYFLTGILGQIFHYALETTLLGGSSTAIFGTVGSIFAYVLRNRGSSVKAFPILSGVGLLAG